MNRLPFTRPRDLHFTCNHDDSSPTNAVELMEKREQSRELTAEGERRVRRWKNGTWENGLKRGKTGCMNNRKREVSGIVSRKFVLHRTTFETQIFVLKRLIVDE